MHEGGDDVRRAMRYDVGDIVYDVEFKEFGTVISREIPHAHLVGYWLVKFIHRKDPLPAGRSTLCRAHISFAGLAVLWD